MATQQELWKKVHNRYAQQSWINRPTVFAEWVQQYFPPHGTILELGAGQGQDTRYFAQLGYSVVSTDFSAEALEYSRKKMTPEIQLKVTLQQLDLWQPLPFSTASVDAVYSHLALHYFDDEAMDRIFADIHRVLKPEGSVAALFNSTDDPEYRQGEMLENGLILIANGLLKRFFSPETLRERIRLFTPVVLDNNGESYKDESEGVHGLIRFVGKRI